MTQNVVYLLYGRARYIYSLSGDLKTREQIKNWNQSFAVVKSQFIGRFDHLLSPTGVLMCSSQMYEL